MVYVLLIIIILIMWHEAGMANPIEHYRYGGERKLESLAPRVALLFMLY